MKCRLSKLLLFVCLLGFAAFSYIEVQHAYASTSGGGTGVTIPTTPPSGTCKYSGAAFAYHAGTNFDGCAGYSGIYQLEYTWNGNCGSSSNLPSGKPRTFASYLDGGVTYKREGAAFNNWAAAEDYFKSFNGGSDSLSNHRDWAYFCAMGDPTGTPPSNPVDPPCSCSGCGCACNPGPCYTYATFTHDTITASSADMVKSGDTFTASGDSGNYKITVNYGIKRTNANPTYSYSRYSHATYAFDSDWYYPTYPYYSTNYLSNGISQSIPVDYWIYLYSGTDTTHCFYLSYDANVTYSDGTYVDGDFAGRTKKCFNFHNPAKDNATFAGYISVSGSSGLSVDNTTAAGNGLKNSFSLTPTYYVYRNYFDNTHPTTAYSRYAYNSSTYDNDWFYPADTASKTNTKALTRGDYDYTTGTANAFTLNIGANPIVRCYYLRYDSAVTYIDNVRQDSTANFAGKTKKCITISNPPAYYTATFYGATTDGHLNAHTNLTLSNNNTMGVINHSTRITNRPNDYANGTYNDNAYPTDSDRYTATFTHTVYRTDTKPYDTVSYAYTSSAKVKWQVQYSLNGGNWTNYSASSDNISSTATSGEETFASSNSKTITTTPVWTMNYANQGKYIYYCQRLAYTSSSTYKSRTPASGANTYEMAFDSYGDYAYTSPACVTLRNPQWLENQQGSDLVHNINVSGTTTGITPSSTTRLLSGTSYETLALTASFTFDHQLSRTDSGFDESQVSGQYYQPSMYNNCNYAVTTKMWGSELLPGTRTYMEQIYANRSAPGLACNGDVLNRGANGGLVNGYELRFGATSRYSADSWSSTTTDGRTTTCFHANLSGFPTADYPCRSNSNSSTSLWQNYQLLAGQTKYFSQGTYAAPANWIVRYKKIVRCEYYNSGYYIGTYPYNNPAYDCSYDRTEIIDRSPVETTPVYSDSAGTTYSLFRPYNYRITSIHPDSAPSSDITYAGQSVSPRFTVSVEREDKDTHNYLTDLNDPTTYVIGFRIPAGYNAEDPARGKITAATTGAANLTNSGNAQRDLCTNFYGSASRLGFGGDSSRCSIISGNTKLPTNDSNTSYNHVYSIGSYELTYNTASIDVPHDLAPGEKYCVAIAVANSYSNLAPGTYRYGFANSSYFLSSATCSNVAKLPSFHVWSGSVRTNGGIKTSTTSIVQPGHSRLTYGSWADFAVIAYGNIKSLASAASIATGTTHDSSSTILCNTDHLTIANSQCAGSSPSALGNSRIATASTTLDKLKSRYVSSDVSAIRLTPTTLTATDLASQGLDPNSLYSDKPVIIYSSSDLTITTNLTLLNGYYSENTIPQVIIIADGNINIDQSVTHLDAWIVAGGTINTCTNGNATVELTSGVCTDQLTIRGALLARRVNLTRTYGNDSSQSSTINQPAELIKYSSGTLLFSARESERSLLPETTYLHELPARY